MALLGLPIALTMFLTPWLKPREADAPVPGPYLQLQTVPLFLRDLALQGLLLL